MTVIPVPASAEQRLDIQRKLEHLGIDCSAGLDIGIAEYCRRYDCPPGQSWQGLWQALDHHAGSTFSEVFQFEMAALAGTVPERTAPADLGQVYRNAHAAGLSGLALSGGGIRSATFNLGVVQALAELRLLADFDYLSTVSGGGFIGGWLSKWIHHRRGDVQEVQRLLAATVRAGAAPSAPRAEPHEVQFLRRYSNYLTPRAGMFSADTWTLICTYVRNTMLNMTILVALLAAVFLVPRLLLAVLRPWMSAGAFGPPAWPWAAAGFLLAVAAVSFSISRRDPWPWRGICVQGQSAVLLGVCLPLIAAGVLGSVALAQLQVRLADFWNELPDSILDVRYALLLAPGACYFAAWALGWSIAQWLNHRDQLARKLPCVPAAQFMLNAAREGLVHLICAAVALAVGTVLLLKVNQVVYFSEFRSANVVRIATFGMPVLLAIFGVSITLMTGLVGRMYGDESREWWARQSAWTTICALSWLLLFGCVFYLPPLLHWAWATYLHATIATGAMTSILTLLGLKAGSGKATGMTVGARGKEVVALLAPYGFTVLAIAALSAAMQSQVAPVPAVPSEVALSLADYLDLYTDSSSARGNIAEGQHMPALLPLLAWCLATGLLLSWRVDINKFSLYMMYRLRLVRAYFGASTPQRAPHPFTGFDPDDDPPLADLLHQQAQDDQAAPVQRPYHLMNAAVNLVGGKELAWQQRKAGNFVFSPAFCGFELPRMPGTEDLRSQLRGAFRPTALYASRQSALRDNDAGIRLGTAVAVSGAAASPNMGYHSSPPLAFLMTLFNLRLGRWSPNPMRVKAWRRPAPRFGLLCLVAELLGLTDASSNFLYLSDGGHFENLGIYELVRRRCRLIVVIDASADHDQSFEDLGNAVRKCLTDFNVPIEIDASRIRALDASGKRGACAVTGTIRYAQADGACEDGVLLYIKPTIIGGENADILNYSKAYPAFPHQSTADQWFDERQFESYRMLGYQAARNALGEIAAQLPPDASRSARLDQLCTRLRGGSAASATA